MSQVEKEEIEMSIIDHLDELRKKILICVGFTLVFSIVAYGYSDFILVLLKSPIDRVELVFLTPVEGFLTKINIAVFGGVVLASPVLFLQSLLFVSPALYKKEKIVLFAMLPFLIALFFGGIFSVSFMYCLEH